MGQRSEPLLQVVQGCDRMQRRSNGSRCLIDVQKLRRDATTILGTAVMMTCGGGENLARSKTVRHGGEKLRRRNENEQRTETEHGGRRKPLSGHQQNGVRGNISASGTDNWSATENETGTGTAEKQGINESVSAHETETATTDETLESAGGHVTVPRRMKGTESGTKARVIARAPVPLESAQAHWNANLRGSGKESISARGTDNGRKNALEESGSTIEWRWTHANGTGDIWYKIEGTAMVIPSGTLLDDELMDVLSGTFPLPCVSFAASLHHIQYIQDCVVAA